MSGRLNLPVNTPENKSCLVIAQSARSLAQSATAAGYMVHAIDRYGDMDTIAASFDYRVVAGKGSQLDTVELGKVLREFERQSDLDVILGSGLEASPEFTEYVDGHWRYCGNTSVVIRACSNPHLFLPLLDELDIPHPETRFEPPGAQGNWLVKKPATNGGVDVLQYRTGMTCTEDSYFQQYIPGRHLSVVFLADGSGACITGYNETRVADRQQGDFRYAGACSIPSPEGASYADLATYPSLLTEKLGLQGLCGIDIVVNDAGKSLVLELNPRVPATFEFHDRNGFMIQAHIDACRGKLPGYINEVQGYHATKVVFAERDILIPVFDWPEWCSDRPSPGTQTGIREPLCTIHARADDRAKVENLLAERQEQLMHAMHKRLEAA